MVGDQQSSICFANYWISTFLVEFELFGCDFVDDLEQWNLKQIHFSMFPCSLVTLKGDCTTRATVSTAVLHLDDLGA